MHKSIDLTGLQFGLLTVLAQVRVGKHLCWTCVCECGKFMTVRTGNLRRQNSCGCTRGTHGMSVERPSVYMVWQNMLNRCRSVKDKDFKNYGARGIVVCDRWKDFAKFYADMGDKPKSLTLERIDNDGNYEPSNCRWASRKEQGSNRRTNRLVEWNGVTKTITGWRDSTGIPKSTLCNRLDNGWSVEEALTIKPGEKRTAPAQLILQGAPIK